MTRTERLLHLMQLLRQHRRPVQGARIAADLGISLRTLYRDIATLQTQGAYIDGAPGLGYVLQPGHTLPPLMFSIEEIEALALGSRWVVSHGDTHLAAAARQALSKIAAVVPPALRHELDVSALIPGPGPAIAAGDPETATIRQAIRQERKLHIRYRDAAGGETQRTVWPFALGYFDQARVMVAWCEQRQDIRHFRTDRIVALTATDLRYPQRKGALLAAWRAQEGIAPP